MAETVTVTCHTPGCENEGAPIEMPSGYEMDGVWVEHTAFMCGPCGQPIDDVVGVEPQPEPEPAPEPKAATDGD